MDEQEVKKLECRRDLVADCLRALGAAYRGDWSEADGRTIKCQLERIAFVLVHGDDSLTYESWCDDNGIHPEQMCWMEHAEPMR